MFKSGCFNACASVTTSWLVKFHQVKMSSGLDRDPYEISSFIGKIVTVLSTSGQRHQGCLIAVDPVSSR